MGPLRETPNPRAGGGPTLSGYAEYCLWVVGLLWAVWALLWAFGRPWGTFWKGLAPLVRGASRLGSALKSAHASFRIFQHWS